MTVSTASLFEQNRNEVMTPILPADVNGPQAGVQVSANVGAFSRAVNNQVQGAQAPANDGQRLANDALGVSQQLRDPGQGIQAKQSDVGFLFGSVMSSATELLDRNGNGVDDTLEQQQPRVAVPQPQAVASFGIGSGPS